MARKEMPSQEELRKLFDYDPETGVIKWRWRPNACTRGDRTFNSQKAGKPAGYQQESGKLTINIRKIRYIGARIIWKWMTGETPDVVDHINGDPWDNRWENLRNVDCAGNTRNIALCRRNISGRIGVCWDGTRKKWSAAISVNNRTIHLGRYADKDSAIEARILAERKYGFHPNHGRQPVSRSHG